MSWGYKILTFYLGFVALMVFMVYSAFQHKVNLVTTDYYERELQYQDIIDGSFNLSKVGETVFVNRNLQELDILLPSLAEKPFENLEIWLYNQADNSGDIKINLVSTSDNRYSLPITPQISGRYTLKVKWHQDNIPYYFEKEMTI